MNTHSTQDVSISDVQASRFGDREDESASAAAEWRRHWPLVLAAAIGMSFTLRGSVSFPATPVRW
jgi:hypothetical protein